MLIIKVGGGKSINWDYLTEDLIKLCKKQKIILVHGASVRRDEIARKLNIPTRYITSPSGFTGVYTDKKAIEVMTMVYAGLVNKEIVARLQRAGINAVGLSGADGRIWQGVRKVNILQYQNGKTRLIKNTFTGKVNEINTDLLKLLLNNGYLPVITQPAISADGELINTDNDRNIAVMAKYLKVKKIVVLFEAAGLLKDFKDSSSLIKKIRQDKLYGISKEVSARMAKKVLGAFEALKDGVEIIYWGDGRVKKPIYSALKGEGTIIS